MNTLIRMTRIDLRPFSRLLLCALALGAAGVARADDVEKQVSRMNQKAMEDFDALEFDTARKTLIDAVSMLRGNGLDETPLAAKTYLNLGVLYVAGFKDRSRGIAQFASALKIRPELKLDPQVASPELEEAFGVAQKQAAAARKVDNSGKPDKGKPEPPEEVKPPVEVTGLVHAPVDETRPNTAIPIHAQLGTDTGATRLFVFFRGAGQEDFLSSPMKQNGNEWVGVIPSEIVTGRTLQYYLEARDARGRAVVGAGSAPNPYIISISESAAAPGTIPEIDVEDPLLRERLKKKREDEERRQAGKRDHFFIFVMPGVGLGYEPAGNHTEVAYQYQAATNSYSPARIKFDGFALAPFHLSVEAGGLITDHWAVSLLGRFQVVSGANAQTVGDTMQSVNPTSGASGAVAGLLRVRYRFLSGRFHPYAHVDIGGGQIRHFIDLSKAESNTYPLVDRASADSFNNDGSPAPKDPTNARYLHQEVCSNHANCTDSIALGYFLVGGGGGLWYDFAAHFAFIVDVNILGAIGTGSSQSGMNTDIQIGIGAHFL